MTKEQIIAAGQTLKNLMPSARHPVGEWLIENATLLAAAPEMKEFVFEHYLNYQDEWAAEVLQKAGVVE